MQDTETKRIMPPNRTSVPDSKVEMDKHEVIDILKQLEGIKKKLQPLLAK